MTGLNGLARDLYNEFNDEMDLIGAQGGFQAVKDTLPIPARPREDAWVDGSTYLAVFPGSRRALGFAVFHRAEPLDEDERNEFARTIATIARLIASAIENIGYRTEESLRARLQESRS